MGFKLLLRLKKKAPNGNSSVPTPSGTDPAPNRAADELRERLRQAIDAAGGPRAVAERSGIPYGSIQHYRQDRELKATALAAIADACNVTVEWLAAGRGPMRPGESPPAPAPEQPPSGPKYLPLFGSVDMETMADAIEVATIAFAARNLRPSWRRKAQIYMLIYDILREPSGNGRDVQGALSSALAGDEKTES